MRAGWDGGHEGRVGLRASGPGQKRKAYEIGCTKHINGQFVQNQEEARNNDLSSRRKNEHVETKFRPLYKCQIYESIPICARLLKHKVSFKIHTLSHARTHIEISICPPQAPRPARLAVPGLSTAPPVQQ